MQSGKERIGKLGRKLEERLNALREEIEEEMKAAGELSYIELAGRVHDTGEASLADLIKDLDLADIDRHVTEVRAIEAALQRIVKGTYGVCVDCGEAIDHARLEAQPTASRCLACQTKLEDEPGETTSGGTSL